MTAPLSDEQVRELVSLAEKARSDSTWYMSGFLSDVSNDDEGAFVAAASPDTITALASDWLALRDLLNRCQNSVERDAVRSTAPGWEPHERARLQALAAEVRAALFGAPPSTAPSQEADA